MSCSVRVASPLRSYTQGAARVTSRGATVAAVLADLDRRYPGMRFRMIDEQDRIRPHMRVFLGSSELRDVDARLEPAATLHIVQALSGG